ncbi:50S ribosomal protein L4 [Patescibacteria group bacterium]|nr:50S ribosomal protein L4 [Patescibacteria group bacterium]
MAQVKVYNLQGTDAGFIELPEALFNVPANTGLIHEAITIQTENSRILRGVTKDRSEVRGGGKKPWKQKGTGRARHGSSRSPIWSGGGVTFGPTLFRNFGKKINKKARKKALAMLLTDRVVNDQFIVLESFDLDSGKTKEVAMLRKVLPGSGKSALFVTLSDDKKIRQALSNVPKTNAINAKSLNVVDVAKHEYIIASKAVIEVMKETYLA